MSFAKWTPEDDEILIDFVRGHEILYNVKRKDFRQKIWCEVAEILNRPETNCHKRWCYVRDNYIQRKAKPGKGFCSEEVIRRANRLTFLDSISPSQRNTITHVKIEEIRESTRGDTENEERTFNDEDRNTNLIRKHNSDANERPSLEKQIVNKMLFTQSELDETDLFFRSMANIFKKLPRIEQVRLRMQIGTLIGNAELRHISHEAASNVSPRPGTSDSD